jgi:hypothetical protein
VKEPQTLAHEFVEFIPDVIEDGKIYVSIDYATAVHNCCCGCGTEVVTPLSPTDWKLVFDGRTISLDPSIGNWSLPCRSHYWVRNNTALWAENWSASRIDANRAHDLRAKKLYFSTLEEISAELRFPAPNRNELVAQVLVKKRWWRRFWRWRQKVSDGSL